MTYSAVCSTSTAELHERICAPYVLAARPAPRLLLGGLNLGWWVLLLASRRGWPGSGRGDTIPNSRPDRQLDHVLRHDPAGVLRPRGARVVAAPVSDHRALVVDLDVATP